MLGISDLRAETGREGEEGEMWGEKEKKMKDWAVGAMSAGE